MGVKPAILIVAASGRALAASAARGGFVPYVADFFADQDTLAVAGRTRRLPSGLPAGMQADEVFDALAALTSSAAMETGLGLAPGDDPVGVVCGTGFEDRPHLLAEIGRRFRIMGNDAETVHAVKDPVSLAALCAACQIPYPEIALKRPAEPEGWLKKRRGGAGGSHVSTDLDRPKGGTSYFQRHLGGQSVSIAFLAHAGRAVVLGFSAQWTSPTREAPFRYGGAVAPAQISPSVAETLAGWVARLVAAVPLAGLNSVDALVAADDTAFLLDVNPRPGATLDIFEPEQGSLFALHVKACCGALPAGMAGRAGASATTIVYADRDIEFVPALAWPAWTADRPRAGTAIRAGEPLCTVLATERTAGSARAMVERRREAILSGFCEKVA